MNKKEIKEIKGWRKALDETEEMWKKATYNSTEEFWDMGECKLCEYDNDLLSMGLSKDHCMACPARREILGERCFRITANADMTKNRRPVFNAIRKCRKYLDDLEAGKK